MTKIPGARLREHLSVGDAHGAGSFNAIKCLDLREQRAVIQELLALREQRPTRPRVTHTHAYLDVDAATFADVRARLEAVDYSHTFGEDDEGARTIDMHGIALRENSTEGPDDMPAAWLVANAPDHVIRYVASMLALLGKRDDALDAIEDITASCPRGCAGTVRAMRYVLERS